MLAIAPVLQTRQLPSDEYLLKAFGTTFCKEQQRRILWIVDHYAQPWEPTDFPTKVHDWRLQAYSTSELTKAHIVLRCDRDRRASAHEEVVKAAQRLDVLDRVRNIRFEGRSLHALKNQMKYEAWVRLARGTMEALDVLHPLTDDMLLLYQELKVYNQGIAPQLPLIRFGRLPGMDEKEREQAEPSDWLPRTK
ncbi:uncharacterized protein FTOL_02102 [Fusarium torulosum]|uniref:Uncharacterized protein n=1 Tax=Fusarium torulosum TaxID=33205 RepID=A0AAE8SEH3_9HYPO|nr:uncharacterized protein FTOL_02102 [Fusarium torulosum]